MEISKMLAGILIGFCLFAIIVAPVAAAPDENNGKGTQRMIRDGLKNDLWNIHKNYRMQFFQLRIERADAIIKTLDKHNCDVKSIQGIIDEITEHEDSLEKALENRDRQALRQINQELMELWHEFRNEARESIRACRDNSE